LLLPSLFIGLFTYEFIMRIVVVVVCLFFFFSGLSVFAQEEKQEVYPNFTLDDIVVFKEYSFKNSKEVKKYKELEADLRVVYPLLQIVRSEYERINKEMGLYNQKSQKEFLKWYEGYANENFKPLLGQLKYQAREIVFEIDFKELDTTPYNLIKQYRNGFSAMFWQVTANMFMLIFVLITMKKKTQ
jgi:hypothetical protein